MKLPCCCVLPVHAAHPLISVKLMEIAYRISVTGVNKKEYAFVRAFSLSRSSSRYLSLFLPFSVSFCVEVELGNLMLRVDVMSECLIVRLSCGDFCRERSTDIGVENRDR